jgi:acyl carrier protein
MNTHEEILTVIKNMMVEMFEIDSDKITLDARLYEDLNFDSIDAIDMIVSLKEMTGKAVNPEDFKTVRTVGDVVETVHTMIHS